MASLLKCSLFIVLALASGCSCVKKFYRFDYEWSDQAGGWLKYHVVPTTWDNARMRCQAEGAILASPLTNQLKAAILAFVQKQRSSNSEQGGAIFSGVHALFSEGDYSSIEGTPLLRLAITWQPGEPNNHENSERCLAMMTGNTGNMADTRCDRVLPYVCYKKDTQMVVRECGPDREYVLERSTGSCYKFHERGLPWSEAYMTCVAEGGYLAIISNDNEARVIDMIFKRHSKKDISAVSHNSVFIGFHNWGHYGFRTIHGETLEAKYHTWAGAGSQASNSTKKKYGVEQEEYCGSVTKAVKLYSSNCNSPLAFLCEKNPYSLVGPAIYQG